MKCYVKFIPQQNLAILTKKSDNQFLSFSIPVVVHSIILFNYPSFGNNPHLMINPNGVSFLRRIITLNNLPSQTNRNKFCIDLPMMCVFTTGIRNISFFNTGKSQFDADIVITYM